MGNKVLILEGQGWFGHFTHESPLHMNVPCYEGKLIRLSESSNADGGVLTELDCPSGSDVELNRAAP